MLGAYRRTCILSHRDPRMPGRFRKTWRSSPQFRSPDWRLRFLDSPGRTACLYRSNRRGASGSRTLRPRFLGSRAGCRLMLQVVPEPAACGNAESGVAVGGAFEPKTRKDPKGTRRQHRAGFASGSGQLGGGRRRRRRRSVQLCLSCCAKHPSSLDLFVSI